MIINEIVNKILVFILLMEMIFSLLEKKIKLEEFIFIKEKIIIILGIIIGNDVFINWIEKIEKLYWVDKVVIIYFGKNDINEIVFLIKLILK